MRQITRVLTLAPLLAALGCQGTDKARSSAPCCRKAEVCCKQTQAAPAAKCPSARAVRGPLAQAADASAPATLLELASGEADTLDLSELERELEQAMKQLPKEGGPGNVVTLPTEPDGRRAVKELDSADESRNVIIVIDDSMSMALNRDNEGMSRFEAVKKALSEERLAKLSKDFSIVVVQFQAADEKDEPKADTSALLESVKPETQPTVATALEEALRAVSDRPRKGLILLLTDGHLTTRPAGTTPAEIQVPVYMVGLGDEATTTPAAQAKTDSDVLKVPAAAVFTDGGKTYCRRVKDGGIEKVEVKVGKRTRKEVEIISGLKEGDTVLLKPPSRP